MNMACLLLWYRALALISMRPSERPEKARIPARFRRDCGTVERMRPIPGGAGDPQGLSHSR
jgi:hypothetical protein